MSLKTPSTPQQVQRVADVVWFEDAMFDLSLSRRASKHCARIMPADTDREEIFRAIDNRRWRLQRWSARESESSPSTSPTYTTVEPIRLGFGSRHRGANPTTFSLGPSSVGCLLRPRLLSKTIPHIRRPGIAHDNKLFCPCCACCVAGNFTFAGENRGWSWVGVGWLVCNL